MSLWSYVKKDTQAQIAHRDEQGKSKSYLFHLVHFSELWKYSESNEQYDEGVDEEDKTNKMRRAINAILNTSVSS